MKDKTNLYRFLVILATFCGWESAHAQMQIPNGGFENWTTPSGAQYQEPTGGWWTTLNALRSLTAPVTVEKSSDAHSGSYSAKLTTATWGTVLLPGLLVSGEFDIQNPNFLVQGQPWVDLPLAFQGWYKYTSVNNDSAGIAALLTRWNSGAGRRDTLAAAAVVITASQATWTAFDLPFFYTQAGAPDSILVALVSSGEGQNFVGQAGSTLWIDDLTFEYATAAPSPVGAQDRPLVRMQAGALVIELPAQSGAADCRIIDLQGRILAQHALRTGTRSIPIELADGIYVVEITTTAGFTFREKLIYLQP